MCFNKVNRCFYYSTQEKMLKKYQASIEFCFLEDYNKNIR